MTDQNEPVIEGNLEEPVVDQKWKKLLPLAEAHLGQTVDVTVKGKKHKESNKAFFPILLILVGIILLIQNLGIGLTHFNWWALFIFLPSCWRIIKCVERFPQEPQTGWQGTLRPGECPGYWYRGSITAHRCRLEPLVACDAHRRRTLFHIERNWLLGSFRA